jgi:hypothetical protein
MLILGLTFTACVCPAETIKASRFVSDIFAMDIFEGGRSNPGKMVAEERTCCL